MATESKRVKRPVSAVKLARAAPAAQCIQDVAKLSGVLVQLHKRPSLHRIVDAEVALATWADLGEALAAEVKRYRSATTRIQIQIKATLGGQPKTRRVNVDITTEDKEGKVTETTVGDVADKFYKRQGVVQPGVTLLSLEDGTVLDRAVTLRSLGDKALRMEAHPVPGATWHLPFFRLKVHGIRFALRVGVDQTVGEILGGLKTKKGIIYAGLEDRTAKTTLSMDTDLYKYSSDHPNAKLGVIFSTATPTDGPALPLPTA